MDEQPYRPQRHNHWGFAIGQYTPPPGTPPRTPVLVAALPPLRRPRSFVACAPLLGSGFALWVIAHLLGRLAAHQAATHAASASGLGSTGATASVLGALCFVVGAILLMVGICLLGHHVDTLARAQTARAQRTGEREPAALTT